MSTISTILGLNSFVYILSPKIGDRIGACIGVLRVVKGVDSVGDHFMMILGRLFQMHPLFHIENNFYERKISTQVLDYSLKNKK